MPKYTCQVFQEKVALSPLEIALSLPDIAQDYTTTYKRGVTVDADIWILRPPHFFRSEVLRVANDNQRTKVDGGRIAALSQAPRLRYSCKLYLCLSYTIMGQLLAHRDGSIVLTLLALREGDGRRGLPCREQLASFILSRTVAMPATGRRAKYHPRVATTGYLVA